MDQRFIIFITTAVVGLGIGLGMSLIHRDPTPKIARPAEPSTITPGTPALTAIANPSPPDPKVKSAKERLEKIDRLKKIEDYHSRYKALQPIFHSWAQNDAEGAFEAWQHTPEVSGMGFSYPIISRLHKKHGFAPLLDQVLEIPQPKARDEALRQVASEVYAAADHQAATELLLEKIPQTERGKIMSRAIGSWRMKAEIGEVWDWVESNREQFDESTLGQLERAAAQALLNTYPKQGIEWLMARATPDSRSEHLASIARTWARQEPNATAEWLSSLPAGPQNDEALAAFSQQVVTDDPESAAHWAATITDPDRRNRELNRAISHWRVTDPQAAAQFEQAQSSTPATR